MSDHLEEENPGRNYELNKKLFKNRDHDKKIKNPISKGSVRSKNKKVLKRFLDNYTTDQLEDDEDYDEWDFK